MATFITRFEAAAPGSTTEPSGRPQAPTEPSGRPQAATEPSGRPQAAVLRLAVKDLIDMVGVPTTNGSKVIAARARPAGADAACLAGTRAAEAEGALVVVGKTNLHELAFGVTGINPWFGTPVNPLDSRLVPGGSSSGSAVAVGADEADVAFGSDTGGSIRIPAACCGVVGLKTTRGRVSLDGVLPLAPSLDTVGPMARTVADVARGMALLEPGFVPAGPEGREPVVGRLRLPAERRVDEALDAALAAAGLRVTDVVLPGWWPATAATMRILGAEAWQVHGDLWALHADELSPDVNARLRDASSVTPDDLRAAWQRAGQWETELAGAFERVDILALPVLAGPPPPLDDAARLTDIRYAAPFNLAGVPALALPVPAASPGIPPSLQLVGPPLSEERLVAIGLQVEAAADDRR
jgi:amidase